MSKQPVCPKCKGRLQVVTDYVDGGNAKIDVIKCTICGHRVLERDHVEAPRVSAPGKTAEKGKAESPRLPTVEEQPPAVSAPSSRRLGYIKKTAGTLGTPPCADCGRPGLKHPSRGLCARCWNKNKEAGTLTNFRVKSDRLSSVVPAQIGQALYLGPSVCLVFASSRDAVLLKQGVA